MRDIQIVVVVGLIAFALAAATPIAATGDAGEDLSGVNESQSGSGPDASGGPGNGTGNETGSQAGVTGDAPEGEGDVPSVNASDETNRLPNASRDRLPPAPAVEDPVDPAAVEALPRATSPTRAPIPGPRTPGTPGSSDDAGGWTPTSTGVPSALGEAVESAPAWTWTAGLGLAGVLLAGTTWKRKRDGSRSAGRSGEQAEAADPPTGQASQARASTNATGVRFRPVDVRRSSDGDDAREPIEHPGAPGALLLGHRALSQDRPELAAGWFETATRLEPSNAKAHLCLGVSLRASGQPGRATAALAQAVELDPRDARARLHLARAHVEDNEPREAVDVLSVLAGSHPRIDQALVEDDALAPLHDDPRFLSLLGRLDLD